MHSLQIISASTSGHTDFVLQVLTDFLKEQKKDLVISRQRAEQAKPEDLLKGDVLILACGTWNTGGIEGQLNPHMHLFLKEKATAIDLKGKQATFIALGDSRYRYTANAGKHLQEYIQTHFGTLLVPGLRIVNEPYGQEEKVLRWGKEFLDTIKDFGPRTSDIGKG